MDLKKTEGNPYFYDKVRNAMLDFANIFKANEIIQDMMSKKCRVFEKISCIFLFLRIFYTYKYRFV